ncbi:MAG: hypothetical protein U0271_06085 [Polyangiaceae bacterium]
MRAHRGTSKLKKKQQQQQQQQARASTARLRGRAALEAALQVDPGREHREASRPGGPVRTVMTPRPDLSVPAVSIENVDWEDGREPLSPLHRWENAERALEKRLAELGAEGRTLRYDPKEGRIVWLDDAQAILVEARAQVLATWVRQANKLIMAWADPMLASVGVARIEEMGDSLDVDQATARELALTAGESAGAEFIKAVTAPHGEHYVAIRSVKTAAAAAPVTPGSPVGMVLRGLADLRRSVSQRDEPTDVLRARFLSLGRTILTQSEGPYRDTEWVSRMQRAGRVLTQLAGRLVPPTFSAIAAGRQADEWLIQSVAVDLVDAVKLLEDEWGAFA